MYADNAVIFTSAKNNQEALHILSLLSDVQASLTKSCLLLNAKKTCRIFSKHAQK